MTNKNMLEQIMAIRSSVGDGLNDDEFTRLLRTMLLEEAGFAFLSFSEGAAMFTVPAQDLKNWYPEQGWMAPKKEAIAQALAEKYGLSLYEPTNCATSVLYPRTHSEIVHHHIELADPRQTIVVAHPRYLKIRLLGKSASHRYAWEGLSPLTIHPELLKDLAALYQQD